VVTIAIIVVCLVVIVVFGALGLWAVSDTIDKGIKHYIDYSKRPGWTREQIKAKLLEAGYTETGADRVLDSEAPIIAEILWGGRPPKEKDDAPKART
jgi:hypothetical protein